jgi:predicted AAA+ superfamily ATPase
MAIKFSKEQIIDRMKFENPWWETGSIDVFYKSMKRREYFGLLFPLITERTIKRSLVLMGPRRVGKTVLLYHSIDELLERGIDKERICYLSIETPLYNGMALEELVSFYLKIKGFTASDELFIYFDEIQYLKDWELHLKSLVDSYHQIKFIVSGSAAAALKLKSQESGAGRFTEFILPPLTFHEFLSLTDNHHLIETVEEMQHIKSGEDDESTLFSYRSMDIKKLNEKFIDYINYGGYPELSLSKVIQSDPGRYIRNDIIDKVLMRDLPSLYGISDIQELNSLFTYIAYNSGNEMSLDEISQNSGVAKNTIKKYLTYLEAAFLIKIIHRIDQNGKKFTRANFFKVYLTNPSLRSALFSPITISDDFIGNMVETAIFAQWQHSPNLPLYYARWGSGEIDIVTLNIRQKPDWCIEIKWSNRFAKNPSELKNVRLFCGKHNLKRAVITTIDISDFKHINNTEYEFIPASLYSYTVGKNIISGLQKGFR